MTLGPYSISEVINLKLEILFSCGKIRVMIKKGAKFKIEWLHFFEWRT